MGANINNPKKGIYADEAIGKTSMQGYDYR